LRAGLPTFFEYVVLALGAVFAIYSAYLGTLFLVGGNSIWRRHSNDDDPVRISSSLPRVSVIVAVKDEARVAARLVDGLKALLYDSSRIEFIVVEDGSSDGTLEGVRLRSADDPRFRLLHVDNSEGKAGALNQGLAISGGELIFIMDADCVPQPDLLLKAVAQYRKGRQVLVGYFKILNANQNLYTRLSVFEELLWHVMNVGRNILGLSVPVSGCCSVISRRALQDAGFYFTPHLAEDAEVGLRLLKAGYPGYHMSSFVWQEAPSKASALLAQRLRWYRGYIDASLMNTDVFRHTEFKKALDSMLNFSTPFFALASILSWALSIASIPQTASSITLLLFVVGFFGANLASVFLLGLGLAVVSGQDALEMVKLSPLIYLYTTMLSLASVLAIFQILLRRRGVWTKTPRTGYVDVPGLP